MLALVTIGESPREDIVTAMFGENVPTGLRQYGALDGLRDSELWALGPAGDEHVLVSRLRDGREVELGKPQLIPLVQEAVDRAIADGCTVICILCTGDFSDIEVSGARLVTPDRLVGAIVDVLLPDGTLGVLMPHPGQADMMQRKWGTSDRRVRTGSFSPYVTGGSPRPAAAALVAAGADLLVMDCMGYSREHWANVQAEVDVPVILSNGVTGALLRELGVLGAVDNAPQI